MLVTDKSAGNQAAQLHREGPRLSPGFRSMKSRKAWQLKPIGSGRAHSGRVYTQVYPDTRPCLSANSQQVPLDLAVYSQVLTLKKQNLHPPKPTHKRAEQHCPQQPESKSSPNAHHGCMDKICGLLVSFIEQQKGGTYPILLTSNTKDTQPSIDFICMKCPE